VRRDESSRFNWRPLRRARPNSHADSDGTTEANLLEFLLGVYEVERHEVSVTAQIMVAIVGAVLAFMAIILAAIETPIGRSVSPFSLAAAPTIPLLLMNWVALYLQDSTLRRAYLLSLEKELSRLSKEVVVGDGTQRWSVPRWASVSEEVWDPGRAISAPWSIPYAIGAASIIIGTALVLIVLLVRVLLVISARHSTMAFYLAIIVNVPMAINTCYILVRAASSKNADRLVARWWNRQ
jgi:hypothetical protein